MPECPNCKKEYESGSTCPECGASFTDKPDDAETLLISANPGYEADLVEGSLRSAGIPYMKKSHGGPAGFVRFDTNYESRGVDYYVPQSLLDQAAAVLPPIDGAKEVQEKLAEREAKVETEKPALTQNAPEKPGSPAVRMLGVILFLVLAALVVFGVDGIMNIVRALLGQK